jgi:3'-phosphoadenosine 5'-phosphosulfate sulfotransferase (PAPS reductase)/FAD synthetase
VSRRVRWFSAGAASAIATALDVREHGADAGPVCYIDTGSEHEDNPRFIADVAAWLGVEVQVLRSAKYESVDDVIEKRRYLNGPAGALCTTELKKKVRHAFQQPDDVQVFGYTADPSDVKRAERFVANNFEVNLCAPLIDHGLTKGNVLAMLERQGIRLPAMYELGYRNNNCIGCVKGGQGYWNKVRVDFPDVFARRAAQERSIGASCLGDVFLDELDPTAGNYAAEDITCSLDCLPAEQLIGESDGRP